ncbi:MAG: type II toxin-antitoxin system VapB family antitoxin [Acidimicrobiales bacterium]
MQHRTTIELDEVLLARAKRALGTGTTRATVEEALRRAAEDLESEHVDRAADQGEFLDHLVKWIDFGEHGVEDRWR